MKELSLSFFVYLLTGLLGISLIVVVHELGHLIAARLCKIEVETLQLGFGPAFFKRYSQKHETVFQLGIIPFGGFCRLKGQDDISAAIRKGISRIDNCEEGSLYSVHPVRRIITYLSGPLANIIFAFFCYTVLMAMPVVRTEMAPQIVVQSDYSNLWEVASCPVSEAGLKTGDIIKSINGRDIDFYSTLTETLSESKNTSDVIFETSDGRIYHVVPDNGHFGILPYRECLVGFIPKDSAEYKAGLRKGDLITSVNGKEVTNMFDILLEAKGSNDISFEVLRNGEKKDITFKIENDSYSFSLAGKSIRQSGLSISEALKQSFSECFGNFFYNIKAILLMITGKDKASETVSGTIDASKDIGMMTANSFRAGINSGLRTILFLLASVSISLAVGNLIPITALDGGLVLVSLAELIAGHSFRPKTYVVLQTMGLITVVLLLVLKRFL